MPPCIKEGSVPRTVRANRKVVDIARMPVCCRWDLEIRAAPILIHTRHHAMITVFETYVDRVDLLGRGERAVEQFGACLVAEIVRIGPGDSGEQTERFSHGM